MPLLSRFEAIPQLESVLAASRSPHALLFAANGLLQLFTTYWVATTSEQRETLKTFLSTYLSQSCQELYSSPLHEQALHFIIRLLCRIVKLGWLDGPSHQTITKDVAPLLATGSQIHSMLALDIYISLTSEMQPTKGAQMARLRRTAMSFRDIALAEIFKTGVTMLRDVNEGKFSSLSASDQTRLIHKLLKVVVGSLSFDFMGTIPDETSDDQSTVMIPYNWSNVKDLSQPDLFFQMYAKCVQSGQRPSAVLSLQCLVLFASLRRSLYSREEERNAMLSSYMRGTSQILAGSVGLDDSECYHEFCRLLGRVNGANQLTDLASNPQFSLWIDQVFSFTSTAVQRAEHLPNSLHYLLSFWTVLVPPMITLGEKGPSQVRQYIEQLTVMFLQVRLAMAGKSEETLEDETLLNEILEVVGWLSRLHASQSSQVLVQALQSVTNEVSLTWVVYLFGSVLAGQTDALGTGSVNKGGRSGSLDGFPRPSRSMDDDISTSAPLPKEYLVVGEIITQVLGVMARTDSQRVGEPLELAYLYFMEQFKKLFLAEQAKVTSLVIPRAASMLCRSIGVVNESQILDFFVSKIMSNFQKRKEFELVTKRTLAFFNELVNGSSVMIYCGDASDAPLPMSKMLMENAQVKYLLEHFEEVDFGRTDTNFNSIYYSIVFRLIFGAGVVIKWAYFDSLFAQVNPGNKSPEQAKLVVTLARNLRGVAQACLNSDQYNLLFKYLVDNPKNVSACKLPLFSAAADTWWDTADVVVPVLKSIAEFAHNKSNRINFPQNSPNGLVLFREATKVLSAYGQRIINRPSGHVYRDIYEEKYKGVGAALKLFTNTLAGEYANLGVFELYGDATLSTAMNTALSMCLSIPLNDLSAYIEPLKSVYTFLEHCSKAHMAPVLQLGVAPFCHILHALEDGLTAFDTTIALNACVTIDNVCTFLKDSSDERVAADRLLGDADVRTCLSKILALCVYLAMSGEFASTWSLSRPMLGLILVGKEDFVALQSKVIQQQATNERTQQVQKCFTELMTGIEDNLNTKNRESFTKNLYQFGISLRTT
jgi:exportin-7